MSLIVNVETGSCGFVAYARQGGREGFASSTSPELAARLAAGVLLNLEVHYVRAERKQPGVWAATESTRRIPA